jgi:hypothetical protein
MTGGPLEVDLERLQRVVNTAVGSITQGVDDHFRLRAVSRSAFSEDDPLMARLTVGATDLCFAVELVDAEKGDDQAVKVHGTRFAAGSTRRWAGMLWRAWLRGREPEVG